MPACLRLLGVLFLLTLSAPASAQEPNTAPTWEGAEEGYLLAGKLHQTPDPFSDEVAPVGRDERVRVVPAVGKPGWFAVYRLGATAPAGFAFRPYVSRLGSSDLAAIQQPEEASPPRRTLPAQSATDSRLPSVVFAEDLAASDGVLTQVERWANVRTGPGVGHKAFGVIRPFTPFRVVAIDRGWGKIMLQGEPGVGYVSGSLLHRVEEPSIAEAEPERPSLLLSGEAAGGRSVLGSATVGEPVVGDSAEVGGGTAAPVGVEETTGIVYVTRTGHKYHRATCKHLRSVKFALPLAEAMLDFAPCRTCTPPTRVPESTPEEAPGKAPGPDSGP